MFLPNLQVNGPVLELPGKGPPLVMPVCAETGMRRYLPPLTPVSPVANGLVAASR